MNLDLTRYQKLPTLDVETLAAMAPKLRSSRREEASVSQDHREQSLLTLAATVQAFKTGDRLTPGAQRLASSHHEP